ncbi:MAG: CvpA family protein [Candidatus Curtissbacteria bacterium]|nr:CvpA family protein [Candidatus Curtissbacteria bacterium]
MNWVDLLILVGVLFFAIEGQKRGFYSQVFDILGLIVSLVASLALYPFAAKLLTGVFNLPQIIANPLGFLFVWLVTETIFFALFSPFVRKILENTHTQPANRFLGFIPASINAFLFLAFVLLFIVSLPIRPDIKKDIFGSRLGSSLVKSATVLERPLNDVFGPIAKQGLTFLTVTPDGKSTVPLEFTATELSNDFESEQKMLTLVNQERAKEGIDPVVWDEDLAEVGRAHSRDMFERQYFSHFSPEGKDVGDRLQEAGIKYSIAGENLALAPTLSRAHSGLMNSSGHRRNILDPAFSRIGIGVIDGGVYGKIFTQVFTN